MIQREEDVNQSGGMVAKAAMESAWIIEEFAYPEGPEAPDATGSRWGFEEDISTQENSSKAEYASSEPEPSDAMEHELLLQAERRGFVAGREQGREEGRAEGREHERGAQAALAHSVEARRKEERGRLIAGFDEARQRYVHEVEPEVVRLALAVAARILRREAQMDPLLLSGAVRVALGQLAATTRVRLKVPGDDLELWREAIALVPNPGTRPEVAAGEGMRLGDCIIETEMGSVDLGVRAQLGEIERGFFDRPGSHVTERNSGEETA
jgi:flagellar biosynthesis/type III secretory pathway protein FliH